MMQKIIAYFNKIIDNDVLTQLSPGSRVADDPQVARYIVAPVTVVYPGRQA